MEVKILLECAMERISLLSFIRSEYKICNCYVGKHNTPKQLSLCYALLVTPRTIGIKLKSH